MPEKRLSPIHPGEILLEEFLNPLGLSQYYEAEVAVFKTEPYEAA